MAEPLRIGNCSGFYGDRLSAMREMLEGSADGRSLDVLTGDYLAELTMLILGRDTMKDPSLGYARTFVRQAEDCLGLALERGVRIVANAGGLNPAGLAARLREVAGGLGLDPAIAHVEGDDVRELSFEGALTANAYLGGFGIAAALAAGADVVVTGRVTDASLVLGPAVAHHGWTTGDLDALAGAVVAGHVLECGTQATGGNFSGFASLPAAARSRPLGFPVAEVAGDGSSVITKNDDTGGAVTLDTVTAQLLYEIQSTRYLGPDVTVDLASVRLEQTGPDRVTISGVRGSPPPEQLKVGVNELGGFRNAVELVLTGLDVEAKAAWVREQLEAALDPAPADVDWSPVVAPATDAATEESASVLFRCTVRDPDAERVGRPFTAAAVELALASYPGFTMTAPPGPATPYGIFRAAYVDRSAVRHTVVHADGRREVVPDPPTTPHPAEDRTGTRPSPYPHPIDTLTRRVPLGTFVHARSGDKGGDANLGLWVAHDSAAPEKHAARVAWLSKLITPERIRELVPEAADLDVEVFLLPDLGGVNVVLHGLLGQGVAASTRFDPQAKGLGEWVRSRFVSIEEGLL
ncbi:acyclic terpene utilization AtuA family protein [Nocardioides euryhalodurans]|uniref:DUF1446 domain-containing protein n=1 Tax=Nocardioides euryhalodurans TaxID=2518370 RepID=A0A4V1BE16_9ACTN|nr:acyclic terpene utilization AtuA family protein [Nocardioides euryhalodurans]QBR93052.1 DUF1446 domain-containing protein [Nocardioides euryhalodurans]